MQAVWLDLLLQKNQLPLNTIGSTIGICLFVKQSLEREDWSQIGHFGLTGVVEGLLLVVILHFGQLCPAVDLLYEDHQDEAFLEVFSDNDLAMTGLCVYCSGIQVNTLLSQANGVLTLFSSS